MSVKVIKTSEIEDAIKDALSTYTAEVQQKVNKAVDVRAKELLEKVISDSPSDKGDYAKNWKLRKNEDTRLRYSKILYNKDTYRLTHLLEHGHAIHAGTKRTRAFPHIGNNANTAEREFNKDVGKAVQEVGK